MTDWHEPPPLILASASASRRAMLDAAGVVYEVDPANIDEDVIKSERMGQSLGAVATALAEAKAKAVAANHPGRLVLGGDSMVEVGGRSFSKPKSRSDAVAHLGFFSGKVMTLWSAAALVRDGDCVEQICESAELDVRTLSASFIDSYLDAEWPAISGCVGCFRIEAKGIQLFERLTGSHFTILGMPLLGILGALRRNGQIEV